MSKEIVKNITQDVVGYDSLFEDIAGINIMGFKSIWAAYIHPASYFDAAKHPDWQQKFRPSLRVWFGISAMSAAMAFLWAGPKTAMHELYTQLMTQIGDDVSTRPSGSGRWLDLGTFKPEFAAETLLKWYMVFMPFIYIALIALIAVVYRAWGEKLSYTIRLRYLFLILIPTSFFGLVTGLFSRLLEGPFFMTIMNASFLIMAVLFFTTAYRGPYRKMEKSARIGRSLAITTIMFIAMFLATFIAIALAFFPTLETAFEPHLKYLPQIRP